MAQAGVSTTFTRLFGILPRYSKHVRDEKAAPLWQRLVDLGYDEAQLEADVLRAAREFHRFTTKDDPLGAAPLTRRRNPLIPTRDHVEELLGYLRGRLSPKKPIRGDRPEDPASRSRRILEEELVALLDPYLNLLKDLIWQDQDLSEAEWESRVHEHMLSTGKKLTLVGITYLLIRVTEGFFGASNGERPSRYQLAADLLNAIGLRRLQSTSRKKRIKEDKTGWRRDTAGPYNRNTVYNLFRKWKPRLRYLRRLVETITPQDSLGPDSEQSRSPSPARRPLA